MQADIEEIKEKIENLPVDKQLELIEKIIQHIRSKELSKEECLDWKKLYGLGKGVWDDEDAQEYVNQIREERK